LSLTNEDFCIRLQKALHPGLNAIVSDESGILVNGILVGKNGMCCGDMGSIEKDCALSYLGCEQNKATAVTSSNRDDSSNVSRTFNAYEKKDHEIGQPIIWIIVLSSILIGCLVIVGIGGGFEL